jgi:hypothetical protein
MRRDNFVAVARVPESRASASAGFDRHAGVATSDGQTEAGRLPEIRRLLILARSNLSSGRRPWLAITLGLTTIVIYALLPYPVIGPLLWHSGAVYASLPLASELWRLPMSLFLPTPYLPVWGAAAQLVAVVGIGELVLGRWLTIGIATVGHFTATLTARLLLGSMLGLSPQLAHVLDTGPSAAATAVGAYLLLVLGMYRCTSLLCVALFIAAVIAPGIDGLEHLVALACGLLAGNFFPVGFRDLGRQLTGSFRRPVAGTSRSHRRGDGLSTL